MCTAGEEAEHIPCSMCCLQCIFGITWQDKVPNIVVLEQAGIVSMYTLLKQRRLCWLGHVMRMADGWIPKKSHLRRIRAGKLPQRETIAAIQGDLQAGSENLRNGSQQMGNLDV